MKFIPVKWDAFNKLKGFNFLISDNGNVRV